MVSYTEVTHALIKPFQKLKRLSHSALEMTPPELSADIYKTGIYLAEAAQCLA